MTHIYEIPREMLIEMGFKPLDASALPMKYGFEEDLWGQKVCIIAQSMGDISGVPIYGLHVARGLGSVGGLLEEDFQNEPLYSTPFEVLAQRLLDPKDTLDDLFAPDFDLFTPI